MDWLKEITYFKIDKQNNTVILTPKKLIHDIYFDDTTNIIPYTDGKCYSVYQDITFRILEYLEKVSLHFTVQLNKEQIIPSIIVAGDINDSIISAINTITTNYINSKFLLFVNN